MAPEKRHFTKNLGSIYKLSMGLGRHRVDIQSAYSRHIVIMVWLIFQNIFLFFFWRVATAVR
ncbi:hypothetical protein LS48_04290 [Aequorivita aquimaris]|uniref:Uncharacterized protein n=1 Tax=Aequorivita aquimaris TaxID=1548749 RepID=A0A137RKA2_9FLAO|nr:hypothetical protein LS48_04290 [Aequorivita aquimaris]